MSKLEIPEIQPTPKKRASFDKNITGSVSETIGTGRPAQESIVWLTIKWSFSLGLILSVAIFLFCIFGKNNTSDFPVDNIKTVWSIFVPIITLALGYIFGRGG